jgi:hypothetical protein
MIENAVVAYLIADSTLISLLGITATDSKFYPIIPDLKPPVKFVTFNWTGDNLGDEFLDGDRLQFIVHTSRETGKLAGEVVARRIKELLNVKDAIQKYIYNTDANHLIYSSAYSGGDSLFEPIRQEWQTILYFEVRYQSKTSSR